MAALPDARLRALAYSLVSAPLLRLPDAAFADCLRSEDFACVLDEIQEGFPLPDMAEALELIRRFASDVDAAALDDLARDRTYLARALAPGVGAPPPYESSWRRSASAESTMAELSDVYREAGVTVAPAVHERPDHLWVELMFMRELAAREAQVEGDEAESLRARQAAFFDGHLRPWAADFARAALPHARTGFFQGLIGALLALLEVEEARYAAAAA